MKLLPAARKIGLMLLGAIVFLVLLALIQMLLQRHHVARAAGETVVIVAAVAMYAAWVRYVERRRISELDPARAAPEGLGGLVLGIVLFSATIGILWALGVFRVVGFGSWAVVAPGLLAALATAAGEEIVFRGWLFRTVRDVGGTWIGVAVSAIVFGLLHAFNTGASVVSTVAIALEAGVLLALAYAATDRLWLPIGVHTGWNFTEGSVFGASVSGHAPGDALFQGSLSGPVTLTGGIFGPESSIVGVAVCLVAAAALVPATLRRDFRP